MRQLIRYGLVGAGSNLIIYFVYLLITYIGIEPKIGMTLVYVTGASVGFIGNRKWTFPDHCASSNPALRYFFAHLLGYLLNFFILFIFVDHLKFNHQWIQAAAIVIVAVFLFVVFKYFVFVRKVTDMKR